MWGNANKTKGTMGSTIDIIAKTWGCFNYRPVQQKIKVIWINHINRLPPGALTKYQIARGNPTK